MAKPPLSTTGRTREELQYLMLLYVKARRTSLHPRSGDRLFRWFIGTTGDAWFLRSRPLVSGGDSCREQPPTQQPSGCELPSEKRQESTNPTTGGARGIGEGVPNNWASNRSCRILRQLGARGSACRPGCAPRIRAADSPYLLSKSRLPVSAGIRRQVPQL